MNMIYILSLSAFHGIAIFKVDDEYVQTAYFYKTVGTKGRNKIRYDEDDRAYFIKSGVRYYLDDFMAVGADFLDRLEGKAS